MPDWQEAISYIDLSYFGDRYVSNLGENMKFEWAKPASGNAFSPKFRLTRFKSIPCDIAKQMNIALGFQAFLFAITDGVTSLTKDPPGLTGGLPRLGKSNIRPPTKSHFPAFSMDSKAQKPFAALQS